MSSEVKVASANDVSRLPIVLTVPEVAALLRTTPKAIYSMVERDGLPGVFRVGRRVLFRRDDLVRVMWRTQSNTGTSR